MKNESFTSVSVKRKTKEKLDFICVVFGEKQYEVLERLLSPELRRAEKLRARKSAACSEN